MNIEKIIEEFVFKFKCKKCGKILGGVKNNSTIIFFCWTSRAQNDTGITGAICECGEENLFDIKNILEKLFNMNLKAVFESSSKK